MRLKEKGWHGMIYIDEKPIIPRKPIGEFKNDSCLWNVTRFPQPLNKHTKTQINFGGGQNRNN